MKRDVAAGAALLLALFALLVVPRLPARVEVPDRREEVRLLVRYDIEGSATVRVAPGSGSRDDVRRFAPRIAEALLNTTAHETDVRTSGGKPYAVVTLNAAYARGERVTLAYDATRVREALVATGWAAPTVRVLLPVAPRAAHWDPNGAPYHAESPTLRFGPGTLPHGSVVLYPFVEGAWIGTGLLLVAGTAAFAGISLWPRRRARGRTVCGAVALAGSVLALPFAWPAQDLGMAGAANGFALDLLRVLPLVWAVALPLGPWLLLTPRRRATMPA